MGPIQGSCFAADVPHVSRKIWVEAGDEERLLSKAERNTLFSVWTSYSQNILVSLYVYIKLVPINKAIIHKKKIKVLEN